MTCTIYTFTYTCDMCPHGSHTHKKLTFCISHTLSHGTMCLWKKWCPWNII